MEMKNFDKEYVQRTKKIIETMPKDYEYEVTLLLNCLNGLVCLPVEKEQDKASAFEKECVDKLREMGVIIKETSDEKTFRTVRNAIAHAHIKPENGDLRIQSLVLIDKYPKVEGYHTKLHFSVEQLKEYALFVADLYLKRYKDQIIEVRK